MKKKLWFIIIYLCIIILFSNVVYARFVDTKYPPNSSGYTDLTDEEAQEENSNQLESQNTTSEDFINKSGNNYLKSLNVENATLSPEFERQNERYTVTLNNNNYKKIKINAEAEDDKAKIDGIGEIELTDGINNIRITVTAENGNVKFYDLTIELPYNQSSLRLNSLEVEGVIENKGNKVEKLQPNFDREIFEYTLEVENAVTSLQIKAEADENIDVAIIGGETLEVGENIIKIELSNTENNSQKTTYIIKVNKKEKTNSLKIISISIIIVIIAIVLFIFLIKLKRKRKI